MDILNYRITCGPEESKDPLQVVGSESEDACVVLRSSNNSQTLYIDGAGAGDWPTYVGVTKSRGTQSNRTPILPNDVLGGLQVYARVKEGTSLGYNYEETPLTGSVIFKAGDTVDSSELLIATKNNNELSVKLVLDSLGNLKVSGSVSFGSLTITDEPAVPAGTNPVRFVKVHYAGAEYAMPLYLTR